MRSENKAHRWSIRGGIDFEAGHAEHVLTSGRIALPSGAIAEVTTIVIPGEMEGRGSLCRRQDQSARRPESNVLLQKWS